MFGLPQLGDAVQAMLPDVQRTLRKVNDDLDGLQVTMARANDLLNDRNRAAIAHSLANADQLLSETRPKVKPVSRQRESPAERCAAKSIRQSE